MLTNTDRSSAAFSIWFTSESLHCPPATYLTPAHQLKIMVAWWYTWRKVTWLSFFLKMKKICGCRGSCGEDSCEGLLRTFCSCSLQSSVHVPCHWALWSWRRRTTSRLWPSAWNPQRGNYAFSMISRFAKFTLQMFCMNILTFVCLSA